MLDPIQLLLFVAAAALLALTPGPGIFYIAARTLAGGRAVGIASSVGTGLGGLVHVAADSVGVSALVLASAELFTALKLAGAAYLMWLGWRTLSKAGHEVIDGSVATDRVGPRRALRDGILVETLNPKTAAFFLAFISQFVQPNAAPVALQFILLGLISVALNTGVDILMALAAGRVRSAMAARSSLVKRLQQACGGAMIALGAGLALARRPAA
ncbi:MAG: LysE family translocator [Reyranellaceae bacterium]